LNLEWYSKTNALHKRRALYYSWLLIINFFKGFNNYIIVDSTSKCNFVGRKERQAGVG
jgi:hypothetical protein